MNIIMTLKIGFDFITSSSRDFLCVLDELSLQLYPCTKIQQYL